MSGSPNTTTPTPTILAGYRQRRAKVVAGDGSFVEYIGYCPPNVSETDATGWQILRNSYDVNGEFTALDFANHSDAFTFSWSSYLTYTYD